jgi:hypothetical protein
VKKSIVEESTSRYQICRRKADGVVVPVVGLTYGTRVSAELGLARLKVKLPVNLEICEVAEPR